MTVAAALNFKFLHSARGERPSAWKRPTRFEPGHAAVRPHAAHAPPRQVVPLRGPTIPTAARKSCSTCRGTTSTGRTPTPWPSRKLLPEGTQIRCTGRLRQLDRQPGQSRSRGRPCMWGDQTWQEMMVGTLAVGLAEQDLSLGLPQMKRLDDGEYEVTFSYKPAGQGRAVYLAGTFNEWKPNRPEDGRPRCRGPLYSASSRSSPAATSTSS